MEIYKEVQRLELENTKLKKENEMLKIKLTNVSENVRSIGLQNRKLKHDNERYYNRINTLQDIK